MFWTLSWTKHYQIISANDHIMDVNNPPMGLNPAHKPTQTVDGFRGQMPLSRLSEVLIHVPDEVLVFLNRTNPVLAPPKPVF